MRAPAQPFPAAALTPPTTAPTARPPAPARPPTALPPTAPDQAARAPAQPQPAAGPALICKIKWVWGRGSSEFQAIVPAPDGGEAIVARSPRFRWRLPLSPDATPAVEAAHETLVAQLVAAGWQPCGGGGLLNWYAERFRAYPRGPIEPLPATAPALICKIKWVWARGSSEFQAIVPAPDGGEAIVARSPRFRWRLPLSPDATPAVEAAHETLVGQLVAAGWRRCGGGGLLTWYADQFRAPETFAKQQGIGTDV